ncbi:MAG TPA: PEP-CTERM sorting domain-containing protein [Tepidisphaeraceae bacterium]
MAATASTSFAVSLTVDKTGILNPNPNNLTITEVGNTSLTAARALVAAANTANTGGVLDFQQRGQGGTFINSTSNNNGVDIGNGVTNPIYVAPSGGATGDGLVGTPIFSFYRAEGTVTATNAFDSNLDQGTNVISGGPLTRYPGAVSPTNPLGDGSSTATSANPNYPFTQAPATGTINGGYLGIAGTGSPATMVFNNPLSFFGLTALPRGATRDTLITLTFSDGSTAPIGGATVVGANAVFFGFTAPEGLTITQAAITNPNGAGQNRYDDLAFVVAPVVPEPTALATLAVGGLVALRRRRAR